MNFRAEWVRGCAEKGKTHIAAPEVKGQSFYPLSYLPLVSSTSIKPACSAGSTYKLNQLVPYYATLQPPCICIYYLLKKIILPLAYFPNTIFFFQFASVIINQTTAFLMEHKNIPPIYLSYSSKLPFAVLNRKWAIIRHWEVIFYFSFSPGIRNVSERMCCIRWLLGQSAVR